MPPRAQSSKEQSQTVEEKPSNEQPAAEAQPAADMALDDWCQSKSHALGRHVEALSAFYRLCQQKGVGRATAAQFEADFEAFLKAPA